MVTVGLIPFAVILKKTKNGLMKDKVSKDATVLDTHTEDEQLPLVRRNFYSATFQILIAMGIGTIVSALLEKTGLTFPAYIGAMLIGALMRNISESSKIYETPMIEIETIGGIALSLFLSMALMSLKLWELADLAIPFIAMLVGQVILMFLYANFVTFNVMGRDYDAAVLAAGHCGFGMGATPTAIANMQAVTDRYGASYKAFLIVPMVGAFFVDIVNATILQIFTQLPFLQ